MAAKMKGKCRSVCIIRVACAIWRDESYWYICLSSNVLRIVYFLITEPRHECAGKHEGKIMFGLAIEFFMDETAVSLVVSEACGEIARCFYKSSGVSEGINFVSDSFVISLITKNLFRMTQKKKKNWGKWGKRGKRGKLTDNSIFGVSVAKSKFIEKMAWSLTYTWSDDTSALVC